MRLFRPLIYAPPPSNPGVASPATPAPPTAASIAAAGHLHWGWMGKQYRAFARSLEAATAVSGGAMARGSVAGVHAQYTECGYYYQAAASCALERRKCAEQLAGVVSPAQASKAAAPAAAESAGEAVVDRSLPAEVILDGMPVTSVAAGLGVISEVSVSIDSASVIELLTKAYEHFKQSRQLRMILFLASQMAEEYFYSQNYQMAKRFFERVAKTYQKEQWYTVLAHIQRCLRICAQQLGLLTDFVSTSVALLSSRLSTAPEAASILLSLLAIVRVNPSDALRTVAAAASTQRLPATSPLAAPGAPPPLTPPTPPPFPPLSSPIALDLDGSQSLLSCHASWPAPTAHLRQTTVRCSLCARACACAVTVQACMQSVRVQALMQPITDERCRSLLIASACVVPPSLPIGRPSPSPSSHTSPPPSTSPPSASWPATRASRPPSRPGPQLLGCQTAQQR